ncbi:hyaluronate lyase [Actinoplanes ianthinogenes]|uniref:Hyaluronate lyase n=1 Tax=Actinoplanes ianthinogenes TaxID=122358 RepID=A0ABM7LX86_9ACTN|nr:geranylgeranyl reductase family protein [Actinoplanes ianthinogenes]BCJ43939.1 hyaluronate lyase [Actinoplanes ianthinogenes]GGR39297.1 hyaluronate lyase [Actinoplanes ianthinogenes]
MLVEPEWDVAVIGAGPAGLAAAHAAASAGVRVVVLERAEHPRYKTCGGGLLGSSLRLSAERLATVPVRDTITSITFSLDGRREFTRTSAEPLVSLVRRDDFDHAWCVAAERAGATVRPHSQVRALDQDEHGVTVTLADGSAVTARVAIGADGSAGITGRHVGVVTEQQDLGLEVELAATPADRERWRGRVLLDWGPFPGSYGWVFPKDDELTVGVIMEKGHGAETKRYLRDFVDRLGLADREVLRDSGHLTRCRTPTSPVHAGRVLVAGDAAGLLEPWTREGISYALRSGVWAGEAAAQAVNNQDQDLSPYAQKIAAELQPEMIAGRRLLGAFGRHPSIVHTAMSSALGWRAFSGFCRGDFSMAGALGRPTVRAALRLLGSGPAQAQPAAG